MTAEIIKLKKSEVIKKYKGKFNIEILDLPGKIQFFLALPKGTDLTWRDICLLAASLPNCLSDSDTDKESNESNFFNVMSVYLPSSDKSAIIGLESGYYVFLNSEAIENIVNFLEKHEMKKNLSPLI